MHGLISRAAVRHYASHGLAQAPMRSPQLVADVAGELEGIHPHWPRHARIVRLEALRERFSEALAERWHALRGAVQREGGAYVDETRDEPVTVSALHTVLNEGPRVLAFYDPGQAGDEAPCMQPAWAQALQAESVETVEWLRTQGPAGMNLATAYAAAMAPALRAAFLGEGWRSGGIRPAPAAPLALAGLSLACVLALRLYAHPETRAFNLLRACADLRRLFPGRTVASCVDEWPSLVGEAVRGLYAVPGARVWGTLYKGMQSRMGSGWQEGDEIAIDRPLSVTAIEQQSYAGRIVKGAPYDQELQLIDRPALRTQAVMIAAFHPPCTAPQGEALVLPGQVYRLQGSQRREAPAQEGGSQAIVRLVAQKVGPTEGELPDE